MHRPAVLPAIVDRPSYRPRFARIIVDAETRQCVIDGHVYELVGLDKTSWQLCDLETGETSWFRLRADPDGGWLVRGAANERAASVGAAWICSCRQLVKSPLPPRPSLH